MTKQPKPVEVGPTWWCPVKYEDAQEGSPAYEYEEANPDNLLYVPVDEAQNWTVEGGPTKYGYATPLDTGEDGKFDLYAFVRSMPPPSLAPSEPYDSDNPPKERTFTFKVQVKGDNADREQFERLLFGVVESCLGQVTVDYLGDTDEDVIVLEYGDRRRLGHALARYATGEALEMDHIKDKVRRQRHLIELKHMRDLQQRFP